MFPFSRPSRENRQQLRSAMRRTRPKLGFEKFEERAMMAFGGEFALGSEFTDNSQVATASAADGTSVAVWSVQGANGDTDLLGQLYNADGTERGGIINVATGSTRDAEPAVAMDANGDFVVSFTRTHNFGFLNLETDRDIRVRRFNSSGAPLGGSVGVSTSNSEKAFDSDVAMDSNGDFVVAYTAELTKTRTINVFGFSFDQSFTDRDVRARRFNANGTAAGGTFGVDTTSSTFEQDPSVAMADDGRFVVAYEDGSNIHLRQFNANGGLRRVRSIATSSRTEANPDVAVDASGNAVVVWQDATNGTDIKARRVGDNGAREAIRTVRSTSAFENSPSVALSRDGNEFIVAYNREIHGGGLVADHIDVTRMLRSGTSDVVQGHESLGLGMESPSISVDGADRFFLGYNDKFDEQVLGRWGQMGSFAPSDKIAHAFEIELVFGVGLTADQRDIFQQAADRWEEVIVGDLPNATFNGANVDDVRIDAEAVPIDGVSNILGQAAPDEFRSGSLLPIHGFMRFDTADLADMVADGTLFNVILHEMGHVLGVGTLWDNLGLVQNAGTANPSYTGANGVAEFNAARGFLGIMNPATSVPVEGDGGAGTADAHWDEGLFDSELMTGFVEGAGVAMPLSRITVGSLQDMGYDVNYAAADPYSVPLLLAQPIVFTQRSSILPGLRAEDAGSHVKQTIGQDAAVANRVVQFPQQAEHAKLQPSDTAGSVRSFARPAPRTAVAHAALDLLFAQEFGALNS